MHFNKCNTHTQYYCLKVGIYCIHIKWDLDKSDTIRVK